MILSSSALNGWINTGWSENGVDLSWYNTDTHETYTGPTKPAMPVSSVPAAAQYYVWTRRPSGYTGDSWQPDISEWSNIAALPVNIVYESPPANAPAAPGVVVKHLGDVNESALNLYGPVFQDAAGNYYNNGARITNLSAAQIQGALAGAAVALQQSIEAHKNTWLDSPLAPLAVFALPALVYGLPMLTATASGEAGAGAAAATASPDITAGLVQALQTQQAEQLALEQAIATANAAPSVSALVEAANQGVSAANALSDQAAQFSAASSDPAVQAAATQAQSAATTLSTTAANVAAAAPAATSVSTAASLLSGLKMAASAAAAGAALINSVSRAKATAARPVTSITPYTGTRSPYLTQAGFGGTNQTALLLAAGVAAVFLLKRK